VLGVGDSVAITFIPQIIKKARGCLLHAFGVLLNLFLAVVFDDERQIHL
jgi:hypothetical protein